MSISWLIVDQITSALTAAGIAPVCVAFSQDQADPYAKFHRSGNMVAVVARGDMLQEWIDCLIQPVLSQSPRVEPS